ncbi:MAG: GNAT family N-acetyltransferase [Alphaproteobacteria bacterium]
MAGPEASVVLKALNRIADVPAAEWDACAGTENPFVSHAFLSALEDSGCVRPETGWGPYHLLMEDEDGHAVGAVPMYLKGHSQGEYIFDHGWANALERAGGRYYPKLLVAVPFVPASGPRLLVRPGPNETEIREHLITGSIEAAKQLGTSTLHFNFVTEPEWQRLGARGLLQRTGEQFHWYNRDYESFDGFLDDLSSRKRKTIRKERRAAMESDIEIEVYQGDTLREEHWDAFYRFYMDTGSRKWGRPYLNRQFFSLVSERMGERIALIMCRRNGAWIAGALNFVGSDCIYGRHWGCVEDHRFLHFEACYYRAIDYAIEHKLARVEAGAQGPHKLARGYLPTHIYSAHWIENPSFRRAVEDYLEHERAEVDREIEYLEDYAPFRKGERPGET